MRDRRQEKDRYLNDAWTILEGLRLGEVGVWRWKVDTDDLAWTANLEDIHRLPRGSFDGRISVFTNDIHPDDVPKVWDTIRSAVSDRGRYCIAYRTVPREQHESRWIEAVGGIQVDEAGDNYLTGICHDVTDRVRSEEQNQRRLKKLAGVEKLGSYALSENDLGKVLDYSVRIAAEIFDVPMAKVLQFTDDADGLLLRAGVGWKNGLVGIARVGIDQESQAGYTLLSSEPVIVSDLRTETRFSGPELLNDHGVRAGMSIIIKGTGSRPFGVFGIHCKDVRPFDEYDVEALQSIANIVASAVREAAAENHRSLVMREMAHRSGNLLQIVNAIAKQTFTDDRVTAEAQSAFRGRLASLSRANYLIAHGGWEPTRLIALVDETLRPFEGRYTLTGRDIMLPAELSFDLGMVLHELATNSAKYGSLSTEGGRIELRWSVGRDPENKRRFYFAWTDHRPTAAPTGAGGGFGSKLKQSLICDKWKGEYSVDLSSGYRFNCSVPLADVA